MADPNEWAVPPPQGKKYSEMTGPEYDELFGLLGTDGRKWGATFCAMAGEAFAAAADDKTFFRERLMAYWFAQAQHVARNVERGDPPNLGIKTIA